MFRRSRLVLLMLWPWLVPVGVNADVYKFVDATGHVYYTDNPKHSGYRMVIRTPPPFSEPVRVTISGRKLPRAGNGGGYKHRRQFEPLIEAAASRYSVDPALLHAVIRAESGYNPEAVSHKGAIGLMQLMPATAARYGVQDPYDPEENVAGGARYLSDLIDMFESDITLAVAAYNAGENNVIKYGNRVPPFSETRQYVTRVLDYYNRFN